MKKFSINLLVFVAASALLFVACDKKEATKLSVLPDELTFKANDAEEKLVDVRSNVKWTVTASDRWILIEELPDGFYVSVETYTETSRERTGSITVKAGESKSETVNVVQLAAEHHTLSVNPATVSFKANETGTKPVVIVTNAPSWNHTTAPNWLTLEKSGNSLMVTLSSNNSGPLQRSSSITITAGNATPVVLTVEQDPPVKDNLSVNPITINFGANETIARTATITTNAANWDAKPAAVVDWLNIELKDFTLSVNPKSQNTGSSERSVNITVTAGNADPVTVMVKQAGQVTSSLSVSPQTINFPANDIAPKTATITTTAASWDYSSAPDWLTLSKSGNTLTVTPKDLNKTSSQREAIITITAGTATPVYLTVRQDVTSDDPNKLKFSDIVRSTYMATGTPLSGVQYPAVNSWKGDLIPYPDDPNDQYYAVTNWADIAGFPLWVNFEDGKLFLDNSSICKDDGTYVYHYTVGYISGTTFTSAPSSYKYEVKYNKSTKTLDFTGTYSGNPAVVILRRINKSTQVGSVLTDLGLSNAKLVLTSVSSMTPSNVNVVKRSDAPARKSGKVVNSGLVIDPIENVK